MWMKRMRQIMITEKKKKTFAFLSESGGAVFCFFFVVLLPLSLHTALLYHLYILIKMIA